VPGGIFREIYEITYRITQDRLDDSGYVLTFEGATVAGQVRKTEATGLYLTPCGICFDSTEDRKWAELGAVAGERYLSGVEVGIVREGEVYCKLHDTTHDVIAAGDILFAIDDGRVAKGTFTTTGAATLLSGMEKVVGVAMEPIVANTGGKVLTKLELRRSA